MQAKETKQFREGQSEHKRMQQEHKETQLAVAAIQEFENRSEAKNDVSDFSASCGSIIFSSNSNVSNSKECAQQLTKVVKTPTLKEVMEAPIGEITFICAKIHP